jgi:hypothetical protein
MRSEERKQSRRETVKEKLLKAFAEAHETLLTTTALAAAQEGASAKNWGSREILAHIAAWEAEALHRIPLLAAGAFEKAYDADTFNARAVVAIGDQSWEQTERALRQTHQRLVDLLETLEESAFLPGGSAHEWVAASIRHSLEHAQELEQLGS